MIATDGLQQQAAAVLERRSLLDRFLPVRIGVATTLALLVAVALVSMTHPVEPAVRLIPCEARHVADLALGDVAGSRLAASRT